MRVWGDSRQPTQVTHNKGKCPCPSIQRRAWGRPINRPHSCLLRGHPRHRLRRTRPTRRGIGRRSAHPSLRRIPHRAAGPRTREAGGGTAHSAQTRWDAALGFHTDDRYRAGRPDGIRRLLHRPRRRTARRSPTPPRAPAAHAVPGTVHRHVVATGQTAAIGGLAQVAVRAVRSQLINLGESPRAARYQQPGGPGEPAPCGFPTGSHCSR